jgi:large subunit ribosomal protein L15
MLVFIYTHEFMTGLRPCRIVWYTKWENRGYLSREAVQKMPRAVTEDRWKELSEQLNRYRGQPYKLKVRTKK